MEKITDQYHGDPTYAQLHVLTRNRPLVREMLKTASFETKTSEAEALPSTAFAWEDERRFPLHTKEDTLASVLYRSKLGSAVPSYVDDKMAKAIAVYGLEDHIFAAKTASVPSQKVAFALEEDNRLPLGTPDQIKTAEQVLCRDYQRLPFEKRADAFSRLVLAAREHGVTLAPLSQKLAGMTICSTHTLRTWLGARAAVTEGPVQQAFDKLAEDLRVAPTYIQDRKDLVKLASTVNQLDSRAGLEKHYDRQLPDPLLTVFNTEKTAMLTVDLAGMQAPVAEIMQLPPEVWEQVDAPELAEIAASGDESTFKQVFDTMPLDIKMALRGQLQG